MMSRWGEGGGTAPTRRSSVAVSCSIVMRVPGGISPPVRALPKIRPSGSSAPDSDPKKLHAPHSASTRASSSQLRLRSATSPINSDAAATASAVPRMPRTTAAGAGGACSVTGGRGVGRGAGRGRGEISGGAGLFKKKTKERKKGQDIKKKKKNTKPQGQAQQEVIRKTDARKMEDEKVTYMPELEQDRTDEHQRAAMS